MFSSSTSSRTLLSVAAAALVTTSLAALAFTGCGSSGLGGGGGPEADGSTSGSSSGGGSGGSSGGSSGGLSGGSSGGSSGGGSGGGSDGGITGCPKNPCPASQTCCADLTNDVSYCTDSCPSADDVGCIGPSDCSGATPDCCATDVLDGMDAGEKFPHCYTKSLTSACVAKCVSKIQVSCTATETLHVCAAGPDCSGDTGNPNCCLVAGYHVCVSNLLKGLGGLTCL